MGICSSCESTDVATVKLVMYDGSLQEYSYPVKVSYLLLRNPSVFICNSDELDFNDVISPISDNEELQLGQLYFALPLNRLKRRLEPEEMASLAVKASSALTNCGNEKCRCRRKISFLFTGIINGAASRTATVVSVGESETERVRSRSNGGGGGSGRRRQQYSVKLGAIPE